MEQAIQDYLNSACCTSSGDTNTNITAVTELPTGASIDASLLYKLPNDTLQFYNGTEWVLVGGGTSDGDAWGVTGEDETSAIGRTGNVGIGLEVPTAKLDVLGNFKLVDGTQGLAKVLTSDANGVASWQTPSSGGVTGDLEFYGVIRYVPATSTWELFNDASHQSKNITSVVSTADTNGFRVNPTYPSSAQYKIGSVIVTPDESLVRSGVTAGSSFAFTQLTVPVVHNPGFGFIMNGTTILADTTFIAPAATDLSWNATSLSLTLYFKSMNEQTAEGLGSSYYNVSVMPGSNSNFFTTKYDINYTPTGVKILLKFYDVAGNAVTPTGRWLFNRAQAWQPLNNQLSKVGANANFWVYGRYAKI